MSSVQTHELEAVLARMSGLCSLHSASLGLSRVAPSCFSPVPGLACLTNRTGLIYTGCLMVAHDVEAYVALPRLRDLMFYSMQQVTPACLPALQAMSGLSRLTLHNSLICMEYLTPRIRAAFYVERLRRGWHPLKIELGRA
jgi:hypothetical protein